MPVLPSNRPFLSNWLSLFSFVVAAANSSTALTSDRVNFINEDQAGGLSLLLNKSTRRSAYSTNISTNSEPEMLKNGTPLLQRSLWLVKFYRAGGPTSKTPLGMRAPIAVKRSGCLKVTTSCSSSLLRRCQQRR